MKKSFLPSMKISFGVPRDWSLATKLVSMVMIPIGLVLILNLSLTISALNQLEDEISTSTLQEDVQIISQQFITQQSKMQLNAAQLTNDRILLDAIQRNDRTTIRSTLLLASTRLGFDHLQILNASGQALSVVQSVELAEASADLEQLDKLGLLEIEATRLVSTSQGWLLTVVIPIKTQSGLVGVLTAGRLLDPSFLADLNFERPNPQLVVFDAQGNISAVAGTETPGDLANQLTLEPTSLAQVQTGKSVFGKARIHGEPQRVVYAPLLIGNRTVAVFALAFSTAATTGSRDRLIVTNLAASLVLTFLAILVAVVLLRIWVLRPIAALVASATQAAAGKLDVVVPGAIYQDEIGSLAAAYNNMISKLRQSMEDIRIRAAQLATVAEVGIATSTILESKTLLQEVVDLTKERFNLYHSHIYLLDEKGENLVLAAGAGEPGRVMVAEGHSIPLDRERSLVARAARERRGITVNDVTQAPDFLPNPLLPSTHSELAVPMIVGGNVIGVFDIQSDQVSRFTEADVNIQTTLAGQVATSIQNVLSFEQSKTQSQLGSLVASIGQTIQRATTVEDTLQVAIREIGLALGAARVHVNIGRNRNDGHEAGHNPASNN